MLNTKKFLFVGDNLFLDFVNTKIQRNGKPFDLLENFKDFLAWSVAVGLINKTQAENFLSDKGQVKQFAEIIDFRDLLGEIAETILAEKTINQKFIEDINEKLKLQNGWIEIKNDKKGFRKILRKRYENPVQILSNIAESVADFLAENNLDNLRKCESENCILYFYDTTKNHSRRWCSMKSCGNRAKANAFYSRKKAKLNK